MSSLLILTALAVVSAPLVSADICYDRYSTFQPPTPPPPVPPLCLCSPVLPPIQTRPLLTQRSPDRAYNCYNDGGLSNGARIGIGLGIAVGVLILLASCSFWRRR